MDICDKAAEREQFDRSSPCASMPGICPTCPATGACHWCDALLPAGARFCDRDCCDDWEREQRWRKRVGLLA